MRQHSETDIRVRPAKYRVGQLVYYYNPRRYKGRQDKWSRKFTGPFCVVRVLGPVNVELKRSIRSKPFICHIDKIKPYLADAPKGWLNESPEVEVAELIENVGDVAEVLKEDESEPDESIPVDNGLVTQPLASEPVDFITFNSDQEFRRNRPRRNVRKPARFED